MRYLGTCLIVALVASTAAAYPPAGWDEVAFLPWGEGEREVGLTPPAEDALQRGPHGVAVDGLGHTAIIDRVNDRALVLSADGEVLREVVLPGKPGAAALTDDGRLAVTDLLDDRLVRVFGVGGGQFRTPRWTLPPTRLVVVEGEDGWQQVEGLNGFSMRLPLSLRILEPYALPEGTPARDGKASAVAFRRDGTLIVRFGDQEVAYPDDIWPGDEAMAPGAVSVLATDGDTAVLLVESVFPGAGPIHVERAVTVVDLTGGFGALQALPQPGPVAIPAPIAARADGEVVMLWSGEQGCSLLRTVVSREEGSP